MVTVKNQRIISPRLCPFLPVALLTTAFLLLAGILFLSWTPTERLDPKAYHRVLTPLAPYLHVEGVDVMQNWASNARTKGKPVLAPLANYPISLAGKETSWTKELNNGAMGAVMAIESEISMDYAMFTEKWIAVPKEKRVFISFAREDLSTALKIKSVMEKRGYVAFIYIQKAGGTPGQTVFHAGEMLRTAGIHLVLDTDIARAKAGVLAEALAYSKYIHPPAPPARGWKKPVEPRIATEQHVVEIYGAERRCSRTREALAAFRKTGVTVRYYDVDNNAFAEQVVHNNSRYLEHGNLLPFIKIDGRPVAPANYGISLQKCRKY